MQNKDYKEEIISFYKNKYLNYGYSPRSLGWKKGRQVIRFHSLISYFDINGKSILDIGCGFGDINTILSKIYPKSYRYTGIDIVKEFIQEGKKRFFGENIDFITGNFLDIEFSSNYDIILGSGIFNQSFNKVDNEVFFHNVLNKSWSICNDGVAFDFLSDKVDFRHDHTYHNNPSEKLDFFYSLSKNVILRNDYIPYEFSICAYKNDKFDKSHAVFNRYKEITNNF